jgi:DNA polymerase
VLDVPALEKHLNTIRAAKAKLLETCGVSKPEVMSTLMFKRKLEELGVTVEEKPSPASVKRGDNPLLLVPALAKTDAFMTELTEHENPQVAALAAARLGHRSTLEEKRSERLLAIGRLPWAQPASLPVPLRYSGAHTHRLSGDWSLNLQNLPRSGGASKLRSTLIAPAGCSVVASDLGQIEARISAWLCGCTKLVGQFARREDPYCSLASAIFGRPITKADTIERFIGKAGVLGLGYGLGAANFYKKTLIAARGQGVTLPPQVFTEDLAQETVNAYRYDMYPEMPSGWRFLDQIVCGVFLGEPGRRSPGSDYPFLDDVVEFNYDTTSKTAFVGLPSGLDLAYQEPHEDANREVWYTHGREKHKLYGAKLLENIVQALARIVVMHAGLRLAKRGYRWALQAHDELVFVVPDIDIDRAVATIQEEMTRVPSWAPGLPLSAETHVGKSYGEAK